MKSLRGKSAEQEIKGTGQKVKGVAQEIVGRVTDNPEMRARGELNQVGGHLRSRAGKIGRKVSEAADRERSRRR